MIILQLGGNLLIKPVAYTQVSSEAILLSIPFSISDEASNLPSLSLPPSLPVRSVI